MALRATTLVDRFYRQQEIVKTKHRAVMRAEVAEKKEQIKLDKLEAQCMARFKQDKIKGIKSSLAVAELKTITGASVHDWRKLVAYITKNNAFELFQRRVNKAAWLEHLEARKQRPVPGIKKFQRVKLSVTKKRGK